MASDLQIGIEGLAQTVVSELNTAISHGSGSVLFSPLKNLEKTRLIC